MLATAPTSVEEKNYWRKNGFKSIQGSLPRGFVEKVPCPPGYGVYYRSIPDRILNKFYVSGTVLIPQLSNYYKERYKNILLSKISIKTAVFIKVT